MLSIEKLSHQRNVETELIDSNIYANDFNLLVSTCNKQKKPSYNDKYFTKAS